ncbi:Endonuclease/exonuclease/phosphatase [Thalictrum thalictroides]|uniref:Endonuclease/exonuclease/phosphatase n=1 Tax=Thalictrum thalictroides TaxID=46969 RepID=A0A7J6WYA2_THATH|nr:Endonuclease/exonuclease/phosphatase [Thalictrum thalictroides]
MNTHQRWSSLLKTPPPSAGSEVLEFEEPKFEGNCLMLYDEMLETGAKEWEHNVVGFFLDKKLPFTVVKETVQRRWKLKGEMDTALDGDMYYFTFHNEEDNASVLDEGPFFMAGKLFISQSWTRDIEENKASVHNVPMKTKSGRELEVQLEYPWKPLICTRCQVFGHTDNNCRKKPVEGQQQKKMGEEAWKQIQSRSEGMHNSNNNNRGNRINIGGETTNGGRYGKKNTWKQAPRQQTQQTGNIAIVSSNKFTCLDVEKRIAKVVDEEIQKIIEIDENEEDEEPNQISKNGKGKETDIEPTTSSTKQGSDVEISNNEVTESENNSKSMEETKESDDYTQEANSDDEGLEEVGLLETKVKSRNTAMVQRRINDWEGVNNNNQDPRGRIWVLWDPCVMRANENVGGRRVNQGELNDFNKCLDYCGLDDLKATGAVFTWSNKQENHERILCKLHRCFINNIWNQQMQYAEANFISQGVSDHTPIVLKWPKGDDRARAPFRFYNHWIEQPEFMEIVK